MKRIFPLFLTAVLFLAASCGTLKYNRLYSYDDEFRGKSKRYTRVRIRPEERRTEIGYARVIIEKESGGEGDVFNAYFVINRSSSSFRVESAGFVKAGLNKYELVLKDPVSEFKLKSEASLSGIATVDSSSVISGQAVDIDTRTWIEEKFVVSLSQEIVSAISGSEDVFFRFYFGPIPATYELKGRKLRAVQDVLKE